MCPVVRRGFIPFRTVYSTRPYLGIHHDGHNCYAISVAPAAQLTPMISGGNGGELPGHVASLTYYDTFFLSRMRISMPAQAAHKSTALPVKPGL